MTGTRKHPAVTWVGRSYAPGAADTFGVSDLQGSLTALSEVSPVVGTAVAFTPQEGDLWWDSANHALKGYASGNWAPIVTVATKPTVTGSRGGNAALASLLAALAGLGILTDGTTA